MSVLPCSSIVAFNVAWECLLLPRISYMCIFCALGDPTPTTILGLSMLTWWLGYSGRVALLGFAIAGTLAIWQGPYVYGCIIQVHLEFTHITLCAL
jgi:hypothetical protein